MNNISTNSQVSNSSIPLNTNNTEEQNPQTNPQQDQNNKPPENKQMTEAPKKEQIQQKLQMII